MVLAFSSACDPVEEVDDDEEPDDGDEEDCELEDVLAVVGALEPELLEPLDPHPAASSSAQAAAAVARTAGRARSTVGIDDPFW